MKWLDRLEQKFGFLAFPGIVRVIIAFQALVFILELVHPGFVSTLVFDRDLVFAGEFWRVVTFVFIPPAMGFLGPLGVAIALYFLWILGDGLEEAWGPFKLNLFILVGVLGAAITALCVKQADSGPLLTSILFAFATLYPDFEILLFLILPIKIKWVGWMALIPVAIWFISAPFGTKALIVVSFANYILFFGPTLWRNFRNRREIAERRAEYASKSIPESESLHRCAECGKTESSDPELEFRVSADGEEYCEEHLPAKPAEES